MKLVDGREIELLKERQFFYFGYTHTHTAFATLCDLRRTFFSNYYIQLRKDVGAVKLVIKKGRSGRKFNRANKIKVQ